MAYDVEVTDTYGGEANYSWVRRYIVEGDGSLSRRNTALIVRRAKKEAGWTGLRCDTSDSGDMIEVRPVGRSAPCWVMFITWRDVSNPHRYNPEYEDGEEDGEEDDTAEDDGDDGDDPAEVRANEVAGVPANDPESAAAFNPGFPAISRGWTYLNFGELIHRGVDPSIACVLTTVRLES